MLEFIEEIHTYVLDGEIIPSVSDILKFMFPNKYKGVSEEILEKKAEYGSIVHLAIENLENGLKMPELNYLQEASIEEYERLKRKNNLEVVTQEQMVNYKRFYAGRFDMIATINSKECLCDVKTTSELDLEYLSYQLSFYELAYGKQFDDLYAIWLPKGKLGKLVKIERKTKEKLHRVLTEFYKSSDWVRGN